MTNDVWTTEHKTIIPFAYDDGDDDLEHFIKMSKNHAICIIQKGTPTLATSD